jgi:hypothetical protein
MSSQNPTSSTVRLLPLDPAPFAVHLPVPFVRLGLEPGRARTWAALLCSETGAVIDRLVLKLPGEEGGEAPFPGEGPLPNSAREAEWAAAHGDLLRLLAAPGCFPELMLPGTAEALLPPLLFCPAAVRLFPIPCPRCFAPLHTCRDDAALAAAGLPLFSASAARFLACPGCAEAEPRFWAATKEEARGRGEKVGTLEDLRKELAAALKGGGGSADLPKTAVTGWTVFNAHDAPYQITRMAPLPFDAFVARLGGVPEGEEAPSGLLFGAEGSGIDAVETLCLKLAAFQQIVAALRQHYLLLDRPHLDLRPEHLVVEPAPRSESRSDLLPSLWSFRVKVLGASSARPAALASGISMPLPPPAPKAPFAAPAVRAARLASPSTGELMVERVLAEKSGDLHRIEGTLLDSHGFYPPPTLRDWIHLALPEDLFGPGRTAVARIDPRTTPQGIEAAVTTEPLDLDAALAKRLGRAGGFRVPGVRYRIYPALGIAQDLWSLGVLLLRLLLVNDGQGIAALDPILEAVPQGIAQRGPRKTVEETLASLLATEPQRIAKANLFHRAADRLPERPNAVPDDLWNRTLLFALRLLARGPGFGLTPEPEGTFAWNESSPASHLDAVEAQATDLLRDLQAVLFQRQTVHAEIQAVIAELLEEGG